MTGTDAALRVHDDVRRHVFDNGLTLLVRRDTSAPVVGHLHAREGRLLRRARRPGRDRARARAHVLQGHADARRGGDRARDQARRRLAQRRTPSTTTPPTYTVLPSDRVRARARHPVRRLRELEHRRRRTRARARGHHRRRRKRKRDAPGAGRRWSRSSRCCTTTIASGAGASASRRSCAPSPRDCCARSTGAGTCPSNTIVSIVGDVDPDDRRRGRARSAWRAPRDWRGTRSGTGGNRIARVARTRPDR